MIKKNFIKKLIVGCCACVTLGCAFLLGTFNKGTVSANGIFKESQTITIQNNYSINDELGLNDDRKGLYLSATQSGSSVEFASSMIGLFEMDFRVFSPDTFNLKELTGDTIKNPALGLKTLTLHFDNADNDDSFDIVIEGGSKMNFAVPQAYVRVAGENAGIYYFEFSQSDVTGVFPSAGNTSSANATDRYTALYGTTFSNTAYEPFSVLAEEPASTVIGFDPVSMQVYYKKASGEKVLIWDLFAGNGDGRVIEKLDSFGKYNVTLEFTDIALEKEAQMVIYSLSGQSLAGETLTNSNGPSTYVADTKNVLKNEKFTLPEPSCGDVLGNETTGVSVSATLNNVPLTVYDKDGNATEEYKEGCYVEPKKSGDLLITYVASDADYAGTPFVLSVKVFDFEPEAEWTVDNFAGSGEYGVGTILRLPNATVDSSLFKTGKKDAVVSVLKDGVALNGYDKIATGGTVTLNETGDYSVVYSLDGLASVKSYDITIVDDLPAFNYAFAVKQSGCVGEIYEIPTAETFFNGESGVAKSVLYYPDGSAYSNTSLQLELAGIYRLVYSTEFNGTTYFVEKEIEVLGNHSDFILSYPNSGSVEYGAINPRYQTMEGCLLTSLDGSNVFTYNQVLNLENATKDDLIIRLYNAGNDMKSSNMPTIKLTDIHDPSNVLTIHMNYGWQATYQDIRAYASGQASKGIRGDQIFVGTEGRTIAFAGTGVNSPAAGHYLNQPFDIYFDAEEKAVYTTGKQIVIDFDADYQDSIWEGFTTGEVYLSVSGFANIMVTEIFGNSLSGAFFDDASAPSLFLNTGNYAVNALPNAVVGKPYKIFDATCVDNYDPNPNCTVKVVYGKDNFVDVAIQDGYFTPKYTGNYTIVYTAKDAFGNETVKTLTVNAITASSVTPVDYSLATDFATACVTGETYKIPTVTEKSGGVSDLKETITVIDPDGEAVTVTNRAFVPYKEGTYTLTYSIADYIGSGYPNEKSQTVEVAVEISALPVLEEVLFPEVIMSGLYYELPQAKAIDFGVEGNPEMDVEISAALDGKALEVTNGACIPTISGKTGTLEITYTAQNAVGSVSKSYSVTVVNPGTGSGFMGNYFYTLEGSFVSNANNGGVHLSTMESGSKVQFINALLANSINVEFAFGEQKGNVSDVTVRLYDYMDRNISVAFKFVRNDESQESSYFSVNGGSNMKVSGSFLNSKTAFAFSYLQDSLALLDGVGSKLGYVTTTESGAAFSGFPSGKIWLEFEMGEVYGNGVELIVRSLNNQNLNNSAIDAVRPQVSMDGAIPRYLEKGEKITIPKIIAQDVLSGTTTVEVRILYAGKAVYTSDKNEAFEYTFAETGTYRILYKITDGNGFSLSPAYQVDIVEYENPTITFNKEFKKQVKKGETYELPKYTVSDNSTEEPNVFVTVVTPTCNVKKVENNKIQFNETGKYVVRYFAYDDFYNFVLAEFVIYAI